VCLFWVLELMCVVLRFMDDRGSLSLCWVFWFSDLIRLLLYICFFGVGGL